MFLCGNGRIRILAAVVTSQETIEELNNKIADLTERAEAIVTRASADGQAALTEEQQKEANDLLDEADSLRADVACRERLLSAQANLKAPQARKTVPVGVAEEAEPAPTPRAAVRHERPSITGGDYSGATRGTWGWRSFGEFAQKVRAGVRGSLDPRLVANAPTSYGNEGTGADGGFAVPPDFRTDIVAKLQAEDSLLARTDQQVSSSNAMTIPIDETTPWQTSGGIQAYWEGEAAAFNQSKPKLEQRTVRLNKLTALVPVTDELLEDASAIGAYLRRKAPEKMAFKINDALINGTGVGMPNGILPAACLTTVDQDDSQDAATVTYGNIVNMWNRMYAPCRNNAIWIANQDVEAQLQQMAFPGTSPSLPVYLPPGGLRDAPFSTLMGRPVISTEACPVVGTKGDIILADLSKYLSIVKAGGIRSDMSIHLWFDYDVTAFRFIFRVGGMPWWQSAITRAGSNTNTLSCFVTVETRDDS